MDQLESIDVRLLCMQDLISLASCPGLGFVQTVLTCSALLQLPRGDAGAEDLGQQRSLPCRPIRDRLRRLDFVLFPWRGR